ncbi:MAG: class I SAM-dependent methyltransferase [Pseudomonadota bacterium]|nr:class I SAM-dependent methyltransferase [Pseudomonadota bacterium]
MTPEQTGKNYDTITHLWSDDRFNMKNGIEQHQRAIAFVKSRGKALDVGCGRTGRVMDLLASEGFTPEGLDISEQMITLARSRNPERVFYHENICSYQLSEKYDFISAWDSIWHIPLDEQVNVITKLVGALNENGVLIFSFGGVNEPGDHTDDTMGPMMYYSSLGTNGFIRVIVKSSA